MSVQSKVAPPVKLTPFGLALAAGAGLRLTGIFSLSVVYPLDVAKTRIQVSKGKSKDDVSMITVLGRIFQKEGVAGFYKGFWATMLNTFSQQYAYFFFYSFVRTSYIARLSRKLPAGAAPPALSTAAELLLGAIAGALAQIFTIPVSVIATRQQVGRQNKTTASTEAYDDSFLGVAREIVDEEGVGGLWLGIKPGLVLTVNPAITYGVFERVKSIFLAAQAKAGGSEKLSAGTSFLIGAVSKTLATVVTYPYIMAKVRVQTRSADADEAKEQHLSPPVSHKPHHSSKLKHPGALDILARVLRTEGPAGWYRYIIIVFVYALFGVMASPSTPQGKTAFEPRTPAARLPSSTIIQSSPHYTTTRRHSLYGVEDRIIIDPGSRIWKVGFSGEGRPRDVFYAGGVNEKPLWTLGLGSDSAEEVEKERVLEIRLEHHLRSVFHDSLLTDPKARKVIVVEHALLPLYIKDIMARILFNNLQVPSVSFASSHLLSLLAVGRITGMVVDCGHLESVALPIFAARPMYPLIRTTPLAGSRLTSHIRALLLLFGTYLPPPTSLSAAVNVPAANRASRVPQEILTDALVEEIKARCCFVGDALGISPAETREATPGDELGSEMDIPPPSDYTQSESDFSLAGRDSNFSSQRASSEFSIISNPRVPGVDANREGHLQALETLYKRHSSATELRMRVTPPASQPSGTGLGTLIIPGWVRERAAEVLFEGGDVDERSLAEIILDSLLKVSVDLRKTLASSILVVGGTAMLPGFIQRLQQELARALAPPTSHRERMLPQYDPYAPLRPLLPYFAIVNNPAPNQTNSATRAVANAGKAPAFTPATLAWIGGSLAGALKTGGAEVNREQWDMVDSANDQGDGPDAMAVDNDRQQLILPDWTRSPLPAGAPPANPPPLSPHMSSPARIASPRVSVKA
ncbi:Fungal specific actin related protein [Mycena indigotica]|uniref:Fungal specific actin related protein n=1 Tax=Mycena indigotica TaxID=2126181 RepID=A0A8H6T7J0_9AGAR|nr:Fungal specific actin related protein [Mycena indigotica]KAF7312503.1 Fungal specific actin related protein [Mycena indigotica]